MRLYMKAEINDKSAIKCTLHRTGVRMAVHLLPAKEGAIVNM